MNSSDNSLLVNALPISESIPQEPERLRTFFDTHLRRIASAVNAKEAADYQLKETGCFKLYFVTGEPLKFRNVYRYNMDIVDENGGNLTAGNTYTFAHGISGISAPTLLTGTGTTTDATPRFIPIPFVDSAVIGNQIQLHATSTDIVVTMGASAPTLSQCYVLFEYVKN